jgi:hypothetical protein
MPDSFSAKCQEKSICFLYANEITDVLKSKAVDVLNLNHQQNNIFILELGMSLYIQYWVLLKYTSHGRFINCHDSNNFIKAEVTLTDIVWL